MDAEAPDASDALSVEGVEAFFRSILNNEVVLRFEVERRNSELQAQNAALNKQLHGTWQELGSELKKLQEKRALAEQEHQELENRVRRLTDVNNELSSFFSESSQRFEAELQRLQKEREQAEEKRKQAEKKLRNATHKLNEKNRKLQAELNRTKDEWEQVVSAVGAAQARSEEATKLRQVNECLLAQMKKMKEEISRLQGKVEEEKAEAKMAAEVFGLADEWRVEALQWELKKARDNAEEERMNADSLRGDLQRVKDELMLTQRALVSATQSAAEAELKVSYSLSEFWENRSHEADREVTFLRDALQEALRERDEARSALLRTTNNFDTERKERAKVENERDYFQWLLGDETKASAMVERKGGAKYEGVRKNQRVVVASTTDFDDIASFTPRQNDEARNDNSNNKNDNGSNHNDDGGDDNLIDDDFDNDDYGDSLWDDLLESEDETEDFEVGQKVRSSAKAAARARTSRVRNVLEREIDWEALDWHEVQSPDWERLEWRKNDMFYRTTQ